MDRLTREQIEALILAHEDEPAYERPLVTNHNFVGICRLALQSLSQEAVREEALEEAKEAAKAAHWHAHEPLPSCLASIEALKREPNAAGWNEKGIADIGVLPGEVDATAVPAPAAPDVAEMVKRLEEAEGCVWNAMDEVAAIPIVEALRKAAALLAKLGQGWIPVSERLPDDGIPVLILRSGDLDIGEIRWDMPGFEDTYKAFRYWDNPNNDGQAWEWNDVTHWMPLPPAP